MLFGSTALEVAIGMIFIYLLLSLLCSAIAEYIEAWRNVRAKNLRKGIELLLNDASGNAGGGQGIDLADRLYKHGLIRPLYRNEGKLPSYIPSRTFAFALWNIATEQAGPGTTDLAKIRAVVDAVPNQELKEALGTLLDDARSDFDKARKNIEDWYEGAMDRVSGWYKRQVQVFLLVIGCVTAAAINADSVNIDKALIRDPALRAAIVEAAEAELKNPTVPSPTPTPTPTPSPTPTPTPTASPGGTTTVETTSPTATPTASPTPTPTPDAIKEIEKAGENVRRAKARLDELGLPLGWVWADCPDGEKRWSCGKNVEPRNQGELRRVPGSVNEWALKLFGLFLTGLAISQGAPFWFDLLNKFMVIRSTVKPKEKSQEQQSKDNTEDENEAANRGKGGGGNGGNGGGAGKN